MPISSMDISLAKIALQIRLNFSSKYTKSTFAVLLALVVSVCSFSQSSKVSDSKRLIKFCHAVNDINEGYDDALLSYNQLMSEMFMKVEKGDEDVLFPLEQVDFSSHYGDKLRTMASLERTYSSLASGLIEQEDIVKKIKIIQREKNKLGMFTKAFADYVNSKRFIEDPEKNELSLMRNKINMSTSQINELLLEEKKSVNGILFEAEKETLENHDLKSVLIPMNEDINYITQLLLDSEKLVDANGALAQISSKRKSLAESQEKRLKDADYYLKNVEHLDMYKNFYLRYQSVLTKSQNVLSDEALTLEVIKAEWKLNCISIDQLRNTYQKLKNNALADM